MSRVRSAGFTLIELMVTMAIAAVLMLVAAPNFVEYRRNSELSDAVSNFIIATGSARSAALKTGRNAYVQPNDTSIGWTSGWIVYLDNNWDKSYSDGTDDVITRHEALTTAVAASPAASTPLASNYLMFNGGGYPKDKDTPTASGAGALTFSTTTKSTKIVIENSGRVRSCKTGDTGC